MTFALLGVLAGIAGGSALSETSTTELCVKDISVSGFEPNGASKIPRYVMAVPGANFPIVYDYAPTGKNQARAILYWSFESDRELKLSELPKYAIDWRSAVAKSPAEVLLLGARYETNREGVKLWNKRLFSIEDGGEVKRSRHFEEETPGGTTNLNVSKILGGVIVSTSELRDVAGLGKGAYTSLSDDRTLLLSGGVTRVIWNEGAELSTDLKHIDGVALLSSQFLSVALSGRPADAIARLNSGDDYNGWEGLYELADPGWIYAHGVQYDNAVRVKLNGDVFVAAEIVRIRPDDGWFGEFMRFVLGMDGQQMKRDGLARISVAGGCRMFSRALGRMIYCDEMAEFRDGDIRPIPGGWNLVEYIGDYEARGVAVFRGLNGLQVYDGREIKAVAGANPRRGSTYEVKGRFFRTTPDGVFELVVHDDRWQLTEVSLPEDVSPDFFMPVMAAPNGGIVLFGRTGVLKLADQGFDHLWQSPKPRVVHTTSNAKPTEVQGWNGVLFASGSPVEHTAFHLLTTCAAKP